MTDYSISKPIVTKEELEPMPEMDAKIRKAMARMLEARATIEMAFGLPEQFLSSPYGMRVFESSSEL